MENIMALSETHIATIMVYFPEIFIKKNQRKYQNAESWYERFGQRESSFRDNFTSGGYDNFIIDGENYYIPRIYIHLFRLIPLIKGVLQDSSCIEEICRTWNLPKNDLINYSDRCKIWIDTVTDNSTAYLLDNEFNVDILKVILDKSII